MVGLLVAGLVVFVAGLLAIGFGFPVKEFSFGNTLIVTGVLGACTGLVLFALALVVRELKAISQALAAAPARPQDVLDPFVAPSPTLAGAGLSASPAGSPPWQNEAGARDRPRAPEPAPEPEAAPVPPVPEVEPAKKRRNLLFMSSRRDRAQEPTDSTPSDDVASGRAAPAPAPDPQVSFEDAWPAAERTRSDPLRRTTPRASEPAAAEDTRPAPPPLRRPAEAPPVTILKSGVVDGMAYSLYSDGSIEAQMPEGMIRFASIDELRQHLDQRGA